ncbi:type II toxin-antitoxin system ParD family antitoxin [Pedobacter faecalis]|uniref:type II toxin-antitoxin system ParD family antitoxin n=1 Tax=Pedobacter faecalis TaxID=3041495 RepID=UPI00254FE305|nr:type II toxin-antitoxin system ParD family antitoxin [Pedobacter sp. ELA7]
MARNKSTLLGDYLDSFVSKQIQTSKYSSASEVIRAPLRMLEHLETKKAELLKELKKGEKSGFANSFDRKSFLADMHKKHSK